MANLTKCPHCNSTNIFKLETIGEPNTKLFIPTVEASDPNNIDSSKICPGKGFVLGAYACNDCGIVTFIHPF